MSYALLGPRPRFADAFSMLARDLVDLARVEVQLDQAAIDDFDERDRSALGSLLMLASSAGRPFVGLAFGEHTEPGTIALVSYDSSLDSRHLLGFYPNGFRACRSCGCVADDCRLCVERTGQPCSWTEPDLCSACDPCAQCSLEVAL